MFFRVFFVYYCKLILLGCIFIALINITSLPIVPAPYRWLVERITTLFVLGSAMLSGLLTIWLLFIKPTLACPICSKQSPFVIFENRPALRCQTCGFVYTRLSSFRIHIVPCDNDDSDYA
jgi:hypothetical protein